MVCSSNQTQCSQTGFNKFRTARLLSVHAVKKKTVRKANKFLHVNQPLFSGYFFLGVNDKNPSWTKINSTRGVARVISIGGGYNPIPIEIITELKKRCDVNNIINEQIILEKGTKIKLENGPFSSMTAEVEKIINDRSIFVLIDLIHRKVRLQVSTKK